MHLPLKLSVMQLHQFELAVGMTNCTHAGEHTFAIQGMKGTNTTAGSSTTQGNLTQNGTVDAIEAEKGKPAGTEEEVLEFDVPTFEPGESVVMLPSLSELVGCPCLSVLRVATCSAGAQAC
jgi:hypothetical protein